MGLVGDEVVTLAHGITYRAHGWTIEPTREGMTFTNDISGPRPTKPEPHSGVDLDHRSGPSELS
ncbi:MAG: hypothetical protein K0U78_18875 [Actinomycetia bacterium]|nr:hypothetical protein [Actinomycetes bacterium]